MLLFFTVIINVFILFYFFQELQRLATTTMHAFLRLELLPVGGGGWLQILWCSSFAESADGRPMVTAQSLTRRSCSIPKRTGKSQRFNFTQSKLCLSLRLDACRCVCRLLLEVFSALEDKLIKASQVNCQKKKKKKRLQSLTRPRHLVFAGMQ